jgi:AcrR family transcriptional regulator
MGRPRSFDVDVALDQALQVFWQKGYEGASLTDLTEAMGINRPSLYCAFGSKEELFRKALDRYAEGPASYVCRALNEPTARKVAEKLLYGAVASMCNPNTPNGCIMVQAALACGDETQRVQQELAERRGEAQEALHQRFERAKTEGDLPPDCDAADLARYITTVTNGMAVQAAGGATCDDLRRVIETALRAWPE